MPLYEYHCNDCDRTVEVLIRRENEQAECPQCQGHKLERQLSVPAAPSVRGSAGSLPMASGESCGAPRCCGGMCDF